MIEYLGGTSLGGRIPSALQALGAADAAIAVSLPSLIAKLAGGVALQATVGLSPPAISAAAELGAKLILASNLGISGPSAQVDVTAMGKFVGEIEAQLGAIQAQATLVLALKLLFGTAGIHAWLIEGEIGSMGSELQGALAGGMPGGSGPQQLGTGIYLLAGDNGAISALRAVFGA